MKHIKNIELKVGTQTMVMCNKRDRIMLFVAHRLLRWSHNLTTRTANKYAKPEYFCADVAKDGKYILYTLAPDIED